MLSTLPCEIWFLLFHIVVVIAHQKHFDLVLESRHNSMVETFKYVNTGMWMLRRRQRASQTSIGFDCIIMFFFFFSFNFLVVWVRVRVTFIWSFWIEFVWSRSLFNKMFSHIIIQISTIGDDHTPLKERSRWQQCSGVHHCGGIYANSLAAIHTCSW